jgi:MFS family permease
VTTDITAAVGVAATAPEASLRDRTFVVVVAVQLAMIVAMGSAGIALPAVQEGLGAGDGAIQWFAALFMLGFALVLVAGGRLGDIHGSTRLLLVGFGGFVAATALGAVAPGIGVVLAARLAQGVAGGIASPQLLAIIQRTYSGHARARAFAVFMTVAALAFMLGQLAAGALISSDALGLGWRWAFLVALPLGFLTWPAIRRLPPAPVQPGGRVDWSGAAVLAGASLLVLFPLIQGQSAGWPPWLLALLVASVPVYAAFVVVERRVVRRGGEPLVDLALFRVRSFSVGNVVGVVTGLMSFSEVVFVTLTLQDGFGRSALEAAALTAPIPFANMFGSLAAAPMLRSMGRASVAVGGALTGLSAVVLLATVHLAGESVEPLHLVPGLVLLGFALGISVSATIAITLAEVPERHAGSASGVQSTVLQLASAVGIAVYGLTFFGVIGDADGTGPYLDGLDATLWLTAGLCVVQVALTPLLPRRSGTGPHPIPVADPENLVVPDLLVEDEPGPPALR